MKYYTFVLTSLLIWTIAFAQNQKTLAFDTTYSMYYSKTDFSVVDTLDLWNYELNTTYKGNENDSLKAIGQLIFWRKKSIDDGISQRLYNQLWRPRIAFEIFDSRDLHYCYEKSNKTRFLSSCIPPQVGGDIIIVGKFIFLNRNVCLSCQRYDTQVDYCRPLINYIFSKVDPAKATSLVSLVKQFAIREGKFPTK